MTSEFTSKDLELMEEASKDDDIFFRPSTLNVESSDNKKEQGNLIDEIEKERFWEQYCAYE